VNPDHKFDQAFDMDLGGIQVHIIMTPGHTKSNISVYAQKVLYCGDCVIPELLPNLEEGKVAEWQRWIDSLEIIELLNFEYLVPGHGFVVSGKSDIHSTISRMKNILVMQFGPEKRRQLNCKTVEPKKRLHLETRTLAQITFVISNTCTN